MQNRAGCRTKAFGVEPGWTPYSLRQARNHALAEDVARYARERRGPMDLLDVGVFGGASRQYIESQQGTKRIRYHGVDIFPYGERIVYKHRRWRLHHIDLEHGLPGLESDRYDVVICEQVLEHIHCVERPLVDIGRVLRPGGLVILGVPSFPPGIDSIRRHVVPVTDRLFRVKKERGHVQVFSKRSFLNLVGRCCKDLQIESVRGFRIVSGGILRPLEYCEWWWRLNRRIGAALPSLCVEIQLVARKTPPPNSSAMSIPRRMAA
jgi:SAM-dependent methyltransferase